jgi:hypothetical protein
MTEDGFTLGEIHRLLLEVREDQREIRSDVKAQTGKVYQHSTEIEVLKAEYRNLKDETKDLATTSGRNSGRNWGAGAGAIGGALGGFLTALLQQWGK